MDENKTVTNESVKDELIARRRGFHIVEKYRVEWTPEDIDILKKLFEEGYGISEIAVILQRSEIAVFNRLQTEELFREINKKNPENKKADNCKCSKCELRFSCDKNTQFCRNYT